MIGTTRLMSFGGGGEFRRRCSFCGRREAAVKHLVRARGALICDRCVAQAHEAVASAAPDQKLLRIRPAAGDIADRDAAEAAVEQAFETVFGGGTSDEDVCRAIEQGDNLGPAIEEARQRNPGTRVLDMSVDYVRFLSEDEAEVQFTLWLPQFGSAGLPQAGHAVKVGHDWKVSRDTWCGLVRMSGVVCPPPEE